MSEPRTAYTAVITDAGEYRLGIAKENEAGYFRIKPESDAGGTFESYEDAQTAAKAYNDDLGLTPKDAMDIVLSTMAAQNRAQRRRR